MRYKVSGAIAIPKASWGCAPALPNRIQVVFLGQAAGEQKFFDPAIFQKCWRGSGRAALIAARRQRNPCAMLLAHGEGGEKSDSFSRRGEQDRPALLPESNQQTSCNCSSGTVATDVLLFHVKHCSWGNQLRTVRQNRFAVCLCAVRRWLCCSNWL